MRPNAFTNRLAAHLGRWGLRRFDSDAAYDQWQRASLTADNLATLLRLSERRRAPGAGAADDIAFYDYAAASHVLPVLYSQRCDYYLAVGSVVAERIGRARRALDVGCGVGILTTFYAQEFPQCVFTGVDRSSASIATARAKADAMGLANVRFECRDLDRADPPRAEEPFDLIVATQALLQTEQDPGLPSEDWRTFERATDRAAQADFERRTGLAGRLDRLRGVLAADGRMIICEKTRHLARRVPFQRALAARGLTLQEAPLPVRYSVIEELTDDGPLYVLGRTDTAAVPWDELPEGAGEDVDLAALEDKPANPDEPLYENHTASVQRVWAKLPGRKILQETTREEPDGRQVHIELGESRDLTYLYCANTFDQRQLVLVKGGQSAMLTQYYQELLQGLSGGGRG